MAKPLYTLTIEEAAAGLAAGEYTSLELTEACLARIADVEPKINAFVTVLPDLARAQAKESDERRAAGKTCGTLDGIPYTLKDVYATSDSPTSASSHILEGWVAPYSATVYRKLREAGAVILGKTNTDEFTMGVSTETSYFGVTRNPWDTERVSGGSSGGPAASMAAHMGLFSIGTDTGGSIRQPAAFCGIVGLRATYGRVSRWGEIPMASSLDQTGPMTKTVRDAAIVLGVLAGHDPYDATSSPLPVPDYVAALPQGDQPLKGLRVGIPTEYFGEGVTPEVEQLVREAIAEIEKLGAEVKEVSFPDVSHALAAYYIINPAEVSSNMARYDGIRYAHSIEREEEHESHSLYDIYAKTRASGLGAEVKRRIMLGTYVLSSGYYDAYYKKAEAVRVALSQKFTEIFKEVDVLAAPVSPHTAFKIGEQVNDPLAMYKEDILTVPVNIAGLPGMSVPCGFAKGLPVGLQLIAERFNEEAILNVGAAYQSVTAFHAEQPNL
ncbi:MAG TPA: Asp-tRNA(Asn)/Glu-tRNA(Gln) amidotransferase subunit GatA [Verrucomicrobiae bacterium]|nr:Asp-tRNA(Asn)/Glu-tRNA(Gln) amidotransferase subunit GatA [Verrucomicrobiae bacterium]